jgi:hypothetical protein
MNIQHWSKKEQQAIILKILERTGNLDDHNRSYAQYLCQASFETIFDRFIMNSISLLIIPLFLVYALANSIIYRNEKSVTSKKGPPIAIFNIVNNIIVPTSLKSYHAIDISNRFILDVSTLIFLWKETFSKFPFSPYFCLKVTFKVALYFYNIKRYKPDVFIVNSEYSFTSSILTKFCEQYNCQHINIMHGDKMFYIRDAFFRFHTCYVWDLHYKNLFINLMAASDQFIVDNPFTSTIYGENYQKGEYDRKVLTYYLGAEAYAGGKGVGNNLLVLLNYLNSISERFDIRVRPHPRYSDVQQIKSMINNNIVIEDPHEIDIIESINNSDLVCALYSTVLFQAVVLDKKIVINDLDYITYKKLQELDFFAISKPHIRLSEI